MNLRRSMLVSSLVAAVACSSSPAKPGGGPDGGAGTTGAAGAGSTTGAAGASGTTGAAGADAGTDAGSSPDSDGGHPSWGGPLTILVPKGLHVHKAPNGLQAGFDNRAPTMLGKLVVDLGITSGSYQAYAGQRGFHVLAVSSTQCLHLQDGTLGPDHAGDCRANNFDGLPHGVEATVDVAHSVAGQVRAALIALDDQFPGEGWGHFLTPGGEVRWSDTILTGYAYGGGNAVRIAAMVHVDRAIATSAIGDDACGTGDGSATDAGADPPRSAFYDAACTMFARWLDQPTATPPDRLFVFVQRPDAAFGNAMFAADRLHIPGPIASTSGSPTSWGAAHLFAYPQQRTAVLNNQLDYPALDVAFGVPPENQNPPF